MSSSPAFLPARSFYRRDRNFRSPLRSRLQCLLEDRHNRRALVKISFRFRPLLPLAALIFSLYRLPISEFHETRICTIRREDVTLLFQFWKTKGISNHFSSGLFDSPFRASLVKFLSRSYTTNSRTTSPTPPLFWQFPTRLADPTNEESFRLSVEIAFGHARVIIAPLSPFGPRLLCYRSFSIDFPQSR